MRASQACIDMIKQFEGFRSAPYQCSASKWTIGYGTTNGITKDSKPIDEEEAEELLRRDLFLIEALITNGAKRKLTQPQFDALCCFVYNVGQGGYIHSTMKRLLDVADYDGAAEQFLKWDKYTNPKTGKKEPLAGLTKRRQAERELFLTQE